jgi:DNA-binding transcriptional regulator YdaS (Cro superfamily)
MKQDTCVDFLNEAIAKVGPASAFAAKLTEIRNGEQITAARVWNWVNRDKRAPAEFCPDIEALTGVPCEDLRPDVNWAVLRTAPATTAEQGA